MCKKGLAAGVRFTLCGHFGRQKAPTSLLFDQSQFFRSGRSEDRYYCFDFGSHGFEHLRLLRLLQISSAACSFSPRAFTCCCPAAERGQTSAVVPRVNCVSATEMDRRDRSAAVATFNRVPQRIETFQDDVSCTGTKRTAADGIGHVSYEALIHVLDTSSDASVVEFEYW